jgi:hypothetical protein
MGHILRRNCLINRVNERNIEERVKVKGIREGRQRELMDDLKETRGYCEDKHKALDSTLWRIRSGRGY